MVVMAEHSLSSPAASPVLAAVVSAKLFWEDTQHSII